jgi:hypothetical protein
MTTSIARIIFILIVTFHGLIHLLGFLKAFGLVQVNELTLEISRPVGLLWLIAYLLFIITAVAFILKMRWWWATAIVAALLSQVLIFTAWQDARVGSIANLIILAVALLHLGSVRFEGRYRQDVRNGQERVRGLPAATITEADLQTLPQPV